MPACQESWQRLLFLYPAQQLRSPPAAPIAQLGSSLHCVMAVVGRSDACFSVPVDLVHTTADAALGTCAAGKTPEEIRRTFNIVNDFTPEEEEEVRSVPSKLQPTNGNAPSVCRPLLVETCLSWQRHHIAAWHVIILAAP